MILGAPVRRQGPPGERTVRDLAQPGRTAWSFPDLDVEPTEIPEAHRRREPPELPEVAERDLVRHYTRLSQMNYGVDTGIYPLGSCSMKYNPKLAEVAAAAPGFAGLHPLQPDGTAQGALEMLWRLEAALCEITGMTRATLQPPAGACGELTGLLTADLLLRLGLDRHDEVLDLQRRDGIAQFDVAQFEPGWKQATRCSGSTSRRGGTSL